MLKLSKSLKKAKLNRSESKDNVHRHDGKRVKRHDDVLFILSIHLKMTRLRDFRILLYDVFFTFCQFYVCVNDIVDKILQIFGQQSENHISPSNKTQICLICQFLKFKIWLLMNFIRKLSNCSVLAFVSRFFFYSTIRGFKDYYWITILEFTICFYILF